MSSLKKNFLYNILYQILIMILPLITIPYISRVLGVSGVGIYSYTYSIVNYFMLIALLGINNYGNRTIAKSRDNKIELSKSFFGIYYIQLFMSVIMILSYVLYLLIFNSQYKFVSFLQIIYLFSNMFDINWFFFGNEEFKLTVTRSTILKIITLFLIFTFVKDKSQVWLYTLILAASTLLSQLLLFPFLKKRVVRVKLSFSDIKKHIKPILILFIPVVAVSLYKIMDKIMLGFLADVIEVGYYEQAEKIISVPTGLITALGTVMLPRISNMVSKGEEKEIKKYIKRSIEFMMFLAFPISLGLISVSSDFVPLFLGDSFNKTIILTQLLSITVIFMSFGNIIRTQFLIPKERDKDFTISVIGGAIVNIIANYLLIPKLSSVGACIGTIGAEFFVAAYQIIAVRKELSIFEYIVNSISFFIKAIIMFGAVILVSKVQINIFVKIILELTIGCTVYFILNIKYILDLLKLKK